MGISRRSFLTAAGGATALGALATNPAQPRAATAAPAPSGRSQARICGFTKSFQDWSIPEVCRRFGEIGLDGLDLTVRKGGHIEPKDAPRQLPAAAAAARQAGLEIGFLSTDITDPDAEVEVERLLETAAKLGIRQVKLGYYRYRPFGTLLAQLQETRQRVAAVVKLARKYEVLPCIHVHSGSYMSSHGTLLYELIKDFRPDEVGAYADTLHMALEGGGEGWRQGLDLLAPWLAIVSVKNYAWQQLERDKHGQLRWKVLVVPVADGISPLPEFVATLKSMKFAGTYSLHSEYKGKGSFRNLSTEECLAQTAADLKYFKSLL